MNIAKVILTIPGVLTLGFVTFQARADVTLTTLVSFNQTNGAFPSAGLVQAKDGNFYGTTVLGGPGGSRTNGTVFLMTSSGALTNLVWFDGTNGAGPRAGLLQAADGNFYGTTYHGGTNNVGTIFQLTTNGTLTTLVNLDFDTGGYPIAGLIQGQDGSFYGANAIGGTNGYGTIFKLATNGAVSTLASFGNTNGASPYAGLVQANDGCLYGTTYLGGTYGYGTIFKLTTNGTFNLLYSFTGTNDGANPYAVLAAGADGSFYGTTFYGGTNGYGTLFKIGTNGTLATLVSFDNTNGAYPQAGVVLGADGNIYGTTSAGGAYTNQSGLGCGTVFKLGTNGVFATLLSFDGTNGASPKAGLIQGADGDFYGTTSYGGTNGYGTVFRLSLVPLPPTFLAVEGAGTILTLTWCATVGKTYQMLSRTNLDQTTWDNLSSAVTATNSIMTTVDVIGPEPQRFYRILQLQP